MSEYYWAYDKYGNHKIAQEFSGKPSLRILQQVVPVGEGHLASDYSLGDRIIAPSNASNFKKLEVRNFIDGYFWISFYEPKLAYKVFHILFGQRSTWLLFDGWSMTAIPPIDYTCIWVGPKIEVPPFNRKQS